MVPSKVTDLLPQSLADWLTGRKRVATVNGSVPADSQPGVSDAGEQTLQPPAKRPRYEGLANYFNQPEIPPQHPRTEPDPSMAGPSGLQAEPVKKETRWTPDVSLLGRGPSVTRLSLGLRDNKKTGSPLKPAESPVEQVLAPSGSPFYPGRTRYGGAGARYIDRPNIRERCVAVPSQPLCQQDISISATTRRLMGILERCSTPGQERHASQLRQDTSRMQDSGNLSLLGRTLPGNSNKTQELHVSHMPTLLKLQQGARLRESSRAARRVADRHSAPYPGVERPAPITASEGSTDITSTPTRELPKQTNKIKSNVGRSARLTKNIETELAPVVNLPQASLDIGSDNLPKFSFAPLVQKEQLTQRIEEEPKKTGFKFSMPEIVTHNHISVPADVCGFHFSKPGSVSEKKVTNGPIDSSAAKADWKCDDCWVMNKDTDDKCCACTGPRPVKKPDKPPAKDWQCKECWVYNKDNIDKCIACTNSRNKITSPITKQIVQQWKCNDCWVQNKDADDKCVACGGCKPGSAKPVEIVKDWQCKDCWVFNKNADDKCVACGGCKTGSAKPVATVKDWQCKDCWIFNKDADDKCVACGGSKPGVVQKPTPFVGITQKKISKWTCDDCWVSNDESADVCVACGGANPKKKSQPSPKKNSFSEFVKKQSELWECPSCLTRNNDTVSKCVCCESTRPGLKKEEVKFNFSATPAFKFGIPTAADTEKKEPIESNNNNTKNMFSFGSAKPVEEKTDKKEDKEPAKFTFGVPSAASEKPTFTFNAIQNKKTDETDGVKLSISVTEEKTEKKEPAFKLPTANTGLFTFTANKENEKAVKEPNKLPTLPVSEPSSTKSSPSLFSITPASEKKSSTLFNMPITKSDTPITSTPLFGISSQKTEVSTSTSSPALFGISATKSEAVTTTTSSTLFGITSTKSETSTTGIFGAPLAQKTESAPTLFGVPAKNVSSALPAFTIPSNTENKDLSAPAKTESAPQTQPIFTFGASNTENKSSKFNFTFGSANKETPNVSFGSGKSAFAAVTTQSSIPSFGTLTTQTSTIPTFGATQTNPPPAFGSLTTQSSTVPTFGTLTTQASTTPAFGLPTQTNPITFGAQTTQPPAYGSTTLTFGTSNQGTGFGATTNQTSAFNSSQNSAFGTPTTQASAFGTPATQTPTFGATATSAFRPPTTQTPTFGTATTQAPTFGTPTAQAPTFGNPTTQTPTFGATSTSAFRPATTQPPGFGTPVTQTPTFGTSSPGFGTTTTQSNFAPPNVNLFASQGNTMFGASANQNKPAFSFGGSNTMFGSQPNQMFGSNSQPSQPDLFANSNNTQFNSQPANPTPMGMFGSTPAFGTSQGNALPSMGQTQGMGQSMLSQGTQLGQSQAFNFGSPNAQPVFAFGQQSTQPAPPGVYSFGAAASPGVQFNLGTSTGSPQTAAPSRRPVRRAVRRTQR